MRLVVETWDDRVLPVTALYDVNGTQVTDVALAFSFDVYDPGQGLTIHFEVPDAPNPSGFRTVH